MIEEEVEVEILIAHLHVDLAADQREADAEFEEKLFDLRHQGVLDGPLVGVFAQVEEIEEAGVLGDLLGEVGLRWGESGLEIRNRLALPGVQARPDLEGKHVPRPSMLDGFGGVPEPVRRLVEFVEEEKVVFPRQLCTRRVHNCRHRTRGLCKGRLHDCGSGSLCTRRVHDYFPGAG